MHHYTSKDINRFWLKVNKNGSIPSHCPELGQCWEWTAFTRNGYGGFSVSKTKNNFQAHRVSWELINGAIPDGLFVLHKCDNRACVNPDHLFLGTQTDNMRDRREKGRDKWNRPSRNKLTPKDKKCIQTRYRQGGITMKRLAEEMKVTIAHIYNIINLGRLSQ